MTVQEIQKFVSQPTPRKIPKNIWRAASKSAYGGEISKYGTPITLRERYYIVCFLILIGCVMAWDNSITFTKLYIYIIRRAVLLSLCLIPAVFQFEIIYRRYSKKLKRLLAEGCFVTGHIEPFMDKSSFAVVSFSDQYDATQVGYCIVRRRAKTACRKWAAEGRSVGLLYLPPNKNDVLITDLWGV